MVNNEEYDLLIKEIAKKHELPEIEVRRIVNSQFRVLKKTINEKGLKIVIIKYLGKFLPTKWARDYHEKKSKQIETIGSDNRGSYQEDIGDKT